MATLAEQWAGANGGLPAQRQETLQATLRLMQQAYYEGPWALPPQELMRQLGNLGEVDPWLITDYLQQLGWDSIGYAFPNAAERERAVNESERLYKYSPVAQWSVWLWTSWGLGESVQVSLSPIEDVTETAQPLEKLSGDHDPDAVFQEFWEADRNQAVLATDCIQELSNWLLVKGNRFLAYYASTLDGETTIAEIDPAQIAEIIPHPDNAKRPLFYKREWTETSSATATGGAHRTWYYPDWQAFLAGILDEPYRGGDKTLAETVLPRGAYRADLGRKIDDGATLGGDDHPRSVVCVQHIHHNHKEDNDLWGWPLSTTGGPWLKAHRRFMESRLAVSESKAAFVRRYKTKGGSRAVSAVKSVIASNLSQSSSAYDTNPPPLGGSSEVMNQAIDVEDLPMSTGAGDAKTDNDIFAWHALLGEGLYPSSAGLDVMRYATALAMDKSQSMLFFRYKTFWAAQFRKMARIVIGLKEKYGNVSFGEWTCEVNIDSFSLSDFPDVVKAIGQLVNTSLSPLVEGGVIPLETGRRILAQLWRVSLQALGVAGAGDMTTDEAFGIEVPKTKAVEQGEKPSGEDTLPPPEEGTAEAVLAIAISKYRRGEVSADELAEFAIAQMADAMGKELV